MSNRIYIRVWDKEDVELDAGESIVFESNGAAIRAYFDGDLLKITADERVTISPEASNVFTVRSAETGTVRMAARRARAALFDSGATPDPADVRKLIEAALR